MYIYVCVRSHFGPSLFVIFLSFDDSTHLYFVDALGTYTFLNTRLLVVVWAALGGLAEVSYGTGFTA